MLSLVLLFFLSFKGNLHCENLLLKECDMMCLRLSYIDLYFYNGGVGDLRLNVIKPCCC